MHEWKRLCATWLEEKARGRPCVLATLVHTAGSTYRRPGARALVTSDGRCVGLLSGGCLEGDIAARALAVFETGRPALAVYDMRSSEDLIFGLGLGCEGRLEIWLERLDPRRVGAEGNGLRIPFEAPPGSEAVICYVDEGGMERAFVTTTPARPNVLVSGAGADAPPLVSLLAGLGFAVTLCDAREGVLAEWEARGGAHEATVHVVPGREDAEQEAWLDALPTAFDACVLMNHRFETDAWFLDAIAARLGAGASRDRERDADVVLRYVGLLGPARRRDKLLDAVPAARALFPGVLRGPAGLDLGGDGPEGIALAIAAEIHAVLHGRPASPLTGKEGAIHA